MVLIQFEMIFSVEHAFGGSDKVGGSDIEFDIRLEDVFSPQEIICHSCDGATEGGCMLMLEDELALMYIYIVSSTWFLHQSNQLSACASSGFFALPATISVGLYVISPSFAFSNLRICPSSPARPNTPAMTCTHRKLSSLAGIGYVTHVGLASVSMMPMVGMAFIAHSWSSTQFSSGLRQTTRSGFKAGRSNSAFSYPLISLSNSSKSFVLHRPKS